MASLWTLPVCFRERPLHRLERCEACLDHDGLATRTHAQVGESDRARGVAVELIVEAVLPGARYHTVASAHAYTEDG